MKNKHEYDAFNLKKKNTCYNMRSFVVWRKERTTEQKETQE